MGQIKNTYVKNLAMTLLQKYPEKFTDNFEKNKRELEKLLKMDSKKVRNLVAGYLVRIVKKKRALSTLKVSYHVREDETKKRRRKRG